VLIAWGEKDPWEPIELGRSYGGYPCVTDFVTLEGIGHCPQVGRDGHDDDDGDDDRDDPDDDGDDDENDDDDARAVVRRLPV
jgi:hypothetical protein